MADQPLAGISKWEGMESLVEGWITRESRPEVRNKSVRMPFQRLGSAFGHEIITTGGQDNVQAVAGQMLAFFAEIGCQFPQFPFIAHSRGSSAEGMQNNQSYVQRSQSLHQGAAALARRCAAMAKVMIEEKLGEHALARGGRKGHQMDTRAQLLG